MRQLKLIDGALLFYTMGLEQNAPTIMEHVNSFQKYSKTTVFNWNTKLGRPPFLKQYSFKIIILHYSVFSPNWYNSGDWLIQYLNSIQVDGSYKIAFFQDDYHYCTYRFNFINRIGIDCIYTLLAPEHFDEVYYKYTNVQNVFQTLTGYVDDDLIEKSQYLLKPYDKRSVDVGYRARPLPFWIGKAGQEKTQIAEKFVLHAEGLALTLNIKTGEQDRIYGDAWWEFLSDCKAVLGVESGASIFDIEDQVRPAVEKLIDENPDISFDEVYEKILFDWEGRMNYRVISPRIFESAAFKVCQILYEGTYQGILMPMVHYIPLKKDFSNFDDVIKLTEDFEFVKDLTERAYHDLVVSGKYSYKHFINEFDENLSTVKFESISSSVDMSVVEQQLKREESTRMLVLRTKHLLHRKKWPGKSVVKALLSKLNYLERV